MIGNPEVIQKRGSRKLANSTQEQKAAIRQANFAGNTEHFNCRPEKKHAPAE
jgi:hypothetical protein